MKTGIDKVSLEILINRFQAVVDEMAQVIYRTAHTVFVKETQDYGAVLVSPKGEVFAAPRRYGVLMMIGMPMDDAIARMGDDVREGDIFISNDPDSTGGMVTHLSDVFLWKPVFREGELVCYLWSFMHVNDIGGRVTGSIAPSSFEVYQEGIRVPPQRLYREGELDRTFLNLFLCNTRTPEQNWGDMSACLAGLATAERRVHALLDRYGRSRIGEAIDAVLDYAETQARRVIAHVPDGRYRHCDYIEADMVGLGLVRINLEMHIAGDEMLLDFTGTAPQVRAALNLPTHGKHGHWMLITGLVNWICTREPGIAYNAGLVRPMKVRIPKGSILDPEPGAGCGTRYSTSHKVCDVSIGALSQAVPDELPATDSGQGSILMVAVPEFETGGTRVSVVQPIVGGSGGRPNEDGIDGAMVITNFLKNVPTELVEQDMPEILIRSYGLREDSGGPGRHRGGTGIELELETRSPTPRSPPATWNAISSRRPGASGDGPAPPDTPPSIPEAPRSATSARSTCSTSSRGNACASAPRAAADSATPWTATRKRCARTCATASSRRRRPRTPTGDPRRRGPGRRRRHRGETAHASGRARLDRAARLLLRGRARGLRAALDRVPAGRAAGGDRPPSGAAPPGDAPAPRAGHRGTPRGRRIRHPE